MRPKEHTLCSSICMTCLRLQLRLKVSSCAMRVQSHAFLTLHRTGSLWTLLLSPPPPLSTVTITTTTTSSSSSSSVPPSISFTKMAGESGVDLCKTHPANATQTAAACFLQQGLSDSGVTREGMGFPMAQTYAVACSFNAHWKYSWKTFKSWVMGTHSGR